MDLKKKKTVQQLLALIVDWLENRTILVLIIKHKTQELFQNFRYSPIVLFWLDT